MSQNSHHQRHPQAKAIAIAQAQEQQAQNQMALGLTALAGFLAVAFTAVSLHQAQVKAPPSLSQQPAPISVLVHDR